MGEKSFEDERDRLIQEVFRKLEQDKGILTGSAFRKWQYPRFYFVTLSLFLMQGVLFAIMGNTIMAAILVCCVFLSVTGLSMYQTEIINKRIDKLVQVTGAERELEEKCRAAISQIAGSESKKA